MRIRPSILCLLIVLPVSCASDTDKSRPTASAPAIKPLSERLNESNGYKQDAEGNWLPKSDKRSAFENASESAYFQGKYGKKDYKTADYSKKSWWGNKDYGTRKYEGNTDGGRFQKNSPLNGQGARETGASAGMTEAYETGTYATSNAREANKTGITKIRDTETENRRKSYVAPEIIDWQQQRSLSLEQSKGILGR